MYRLTKKAAKQCETLAAMRSGRERARLSGTEPDYPATLPDLRRRIVIEDFDFRIRCKKCALRSAKID